MVNDNDDDGGRCIGNGAIGGIDEPSLLLSLSISSPKNSDANDGLNVLDGGGGGGSCHGIGDGAAAVAVTGDGGGG